MKKWTLYEQYLLPGLDTIKAPKQVVGLINNKADIQILMDFLFFSEQCNKWIINMYLHSTALLLVVLGAAVATVPLLPIAVLALAVVAVAVLPLHAAVAVLLP